MKILAFDTTNSTLSTAILFDNKVVAQTNVTQSNKQAQMLIPSIEQCLEKAQIWYNDLDLIAFTNGPGSFTGIRIGYSCAQALKISTKLPVIGINTLETIAYHYRNACYKEQKYAKILIVNDAKLDEVFIQEFNVKNNRLTSIYEPKLISIEEVVEFFPKEKFLLAGSAKNMILPFVKNINHYILSQDDNFIDAVNIALLAKDLSANDDNNNIPLYIRKPKISIRKDSLLALSKNIGK
jgi:tRNA threonylcarbamoyladenosine biosynthesis protein TsaB